MAGCWALKNQRDRHPVRHNHYSLPTRVENWLEEWAKTEATRDFLKFKEKRNLLLSSKTKAMLHKLLEPVSLSTDIGTLQYNRVYQISSPDVMNHDMTKRGLHLSGLINETNIENSISLRDGCFVTGSTLSMPSRRNAWVFTTDDPSAINICYGAGLCITLLQPEGHSPLYLQAEISNVNNMDCYKRSLVTSLTSIKNNYCYFKIMHPHPKHRKHYLGSVVLSNSIIIIQHVASGQNLAIDTSNWIHTFFGTECVVTCHTYKNSNRVETEENIWQIYGTK